MAKACLSWARNSSNTLLRLGLTFFFQQDKDGYKALSFRENPTAESTACLAQDDAEIITAADAEQPIIRSSWRGWLLRDSAAPANMEFGNPRARRNTTGWPPKPGPNTNAGRGPDTRRRLGQFEKGWRGQRHQGMSSGCREPAHIPQQRWRPSVPFEDVHVAPSQMSTLVLTQRRPKVRSPGQG